MVVFMKIEEEEKLILETLKSNPNLKAYILEMLDITDGKKFDKLKTGDEVSTNSHFVHYKNKNYLNIQVKPITCMA